MHTSSKLRLEHFAFSRDLGGQETAIDFGMMFPDYHPQDRVGVVCHRIEDGPMCVGGALLALTTQYYDRLRDRGNSFFSYPQHFCVLAAEGHGVHTDVRILPISMKEIGESWGQLDVWPQCKWQIVPLTQAGMLQVVFNLQINRLFWPETWPVMKCGPKMPKYVAAILASDLKQVWYYGSQRATHAIRVKEPGIGFIRKSIDALPKQIGSQLESRSRVATHPSNGRFRIERFKEVPVSAFVEQHAALFDE